MSTLMLEAAREYFRRRWSPIPVPHKSKNPGFKRWQNMRLTEAELTRHFNGNQQNIGILLGEASVGLVDVDLDVTEAVTLAQKLLPQTTTFGHKSKRHSHYLFQTDPIPATAKFTDTDGTMLAELRSSGSQTILPPSTHPSGEQIEWDRDGDPTLIGGNELHKCVAHLATAAILVRHYPSKGSRESAALALAGGMLRGGLNENEVEDFIEAICHAANDEETRSRVKTVVHTSNRLKAGTDATGWPTLAKIIGDNVVNRVREWLGLLEKNVAVSDKEWDQPEPLPDDLLPVPALPEALIPTPVCPWLSDIAERIQCSLEFPTVAAIIAVAAVIGNRISICPKRRDEWKVIPNLWGAIIGRPGLLKSPALKEALRPLNHLVTQARREYTAALEKWEFDQMVIEARKKGLRAEIEKAVKKDGDVSDLRDQLKELKENEPIERRYIVNDPTVEKLGELLNQNPLGLLLFRDELVGWFRSLDRDGHENDRAFYLEAWNGFGRYTYDRIGRGTIHIESITLSILGGIQPGPLSQYLRGALSGEIGADGLMQRFQLAVYPDPPREWHNVDRWPDVEAQRLVFDLFAHLDVFDPSTIPAEPDESDGVPYLRFADDAQEFFDAWRSDLEHELRTGKQHPALEAHLAKYRSLMPALALLFHLLELLNRTTSNPAVSLLSAEMAAAWCSFLFAHAKRIYGMAVNAEITLAKVIFEHIRLGELPDPFTARDVYRKHWSGLTTPKDVAEPLALLQDYGWLRSVSVATGGRPQMYYFINPILKGGTT